MACRRFLFAFLVICAVGLFGQAIHVPNQGQWSGDFEAKMAFNAGAYFWQETGYKVMIANPENMPHHPHQDQVKHDNHSGTESMDFFAFACHYLGSSPSKWVGQSKQAGYRNYLTGGDPSAFASNVPDFAGFIQKDLYPGIDLHMDRDDFGEAKTSWLVSVGADPKLIQLSYDGLTPYVNQENELVLPTPMGDIRESGLVAYQDGPRGRKTIPCRFDVKDGVVRFKLGRYNKRLPLIIDPTLVFSSFSGSMADNWGYTATYDGQGNLYGAGIVFDVGYPITTGALDPSYNDPTGGQGYMNCDIGLTKFSADGTSRIYSTYLGGNKPDQPHSMMVNNAGNLVMMGTTGSNDFITSSLSVPGYDQSFNGGSGYGSSQGSPLPMDFSNGVDIFVAVINNTGTAYTAATIIGGNGVDGLDKGIQKNYGDVSRGEVVVDSQDQVYIVSTSSSSNFPLAANSRNGSTDAVVFQMSSNLASLNWSRYFGGTGNDAGYGLKVAPNGKVFITGSTSNTGLPNAVNNHQGGLDGFIARFSNTGAIEASRYLGTSQVDLSFLIDIDKLGAVYVFGQTKGIYPVTAGTWRTPSGSQFVHKFHEDLTQTIFSTRWGTANGQPNIVPTAFNVDACLNILMSGWGGNVNGGMGGSTSGLFVTNDAVQSTTDGSDFYFLVLERNASAPLFASFFGGSSSEHVDGGTSRFGPDGTIYQAVCAACSGGSFPTTPSVVGPARLGNNCNLGVIKIDFETSVTAIADIDYDSDVDTLCEDMRVTFTNNSLNANVFYWDFGNGNSSDSINPTTIFTKGTWTITLIAMDTICDISDTSTLTLTHTKGITPEAAFDVSYEACDRYYEIRLQDQSTRSQLAQWDYGDGNSGNGNSPSYRFQAAGTYTIRLIAIDTVCNKSDTSYQSVTFDPDWNGPLVTVAPDTCWDGRVRLDVTYGTDSVNYQYLWTFENGVTDTGRVATYRLPASGTYTVTLTLFDSICHASFDYSFTTSIIRDDQRLWVPNTFTPNEDGINELLTIAGNDCFNDDRFVILNRLGYVVFETDQPFQEFWDGKINGKPSQQDSYVWYFETEDGRVHGTINVIH